MLYKIDNQTYTARKLAALLADGAEGLHGRCFRLRTARGDIYLFVMCRKGMLVHKAVLPSQWNRAGAPIVQLTGKVIEVFQWLGQHDGHKLIWKFDPGSIDAMLASLENPDGDAECGSEVFVIDESDGKLPICQAGQIKSGSIVQILPDGPVGWLCRNDHILCVVIRNRTQEEREVPFDESRELRLLQTPEQIALTFLAAINAPA